MAFSGKSRAAQRRARSRNSVDATPIGTYYVSESSRMFGTDASDPLDDSENSSSLPDLGGAKVRETPGQWRRRTTKGTMESIISMGTIEGSMDDSTTKVATGENTAQGAKKRVPEENKNGNPFMNNPSLVNKSKNRVGPFDDGEDDFMGNDTDDDGEIDIAAFTVEEIHNWKNGSHQSNGSMKSLGSNAGGALAFVDAKNDTYDESINPFIANKKGYFNLSKADDRNDFMTSMNGVGGNVPGEQAHNNNYDEEQQQKSPLFQESKQNRRSARLSNDNPFADETGADESDLMIETFKPRSNGMENGQYTSMQELLDGEKTSPFSRKKRKGIGACVDKVFGGKKTKRRMISLASLILLVCGGIGAALYVVLGTEGDEMQGAELQVISQPSAFPSRVSPAYGPIGPSLSLPSYVTNGSAAHWGNDTEGSLHQSNNHLPPSMINGNLTMPTFNVTPVASDADLPPSTSPGNSSSPISLSLSASMIPSISSSYNESLAPSLIANSSFANATSNSGSLAPTPEPSLMSEKNMTANQTDMDANSTTHDDFFGNETMIEDNSTSVNETMTDVNATDDMLNETDTSTTLTPTPSNLLNETTNATDLNETIVPTPAPSFMNASDSLMPSVALNETTNATDLNGTTVPTPTPSFMNTSDSLMPSSALNETTNSTDLNGTIVSTPTPSFMNTSDSLMPSSALNETTNTTDLNETSVPTPAPSLTNTSDSLMPSSVLNETTNTTDLNSNVSLDELSDPWTLYRSIEHDKPSERFGTSLAQTADGSLLIVGAKNALNEAGDATGAVYVYSMQDTGAPSVLQVIYGESANGEFGNAVALSDDGSRLVIASRSDEKQAGAVRIYSLSTSSYSQIGNTIAGPAESGRTGWSVAISGDGTVVAIGSPRGGSEGGGSVLAYQFDGAGWVTIGSAIDGATSSAAVGYSLSLNIDGTILAMGNPKAENRDGSSNAGKVAVYTLVDSEWISAGEIFGQSSEDVAGTSVALSRDGNFLVTGSKGQDGADGSVESTGSCELYQNSNSRRWRLRNTIIGQSADEQLGSWVAISRDGSVFACGGVAATLDGTGTTGVVRLWNRRTSQESTIWPRAQNSEASAFGTSLSFSSLGLVVGAPDYSGGGGGNLAGNVEIFSMD